MRKLRISGTYWRDGTLSHQEPPRLRRSLRDVQCGRIRLAYQLHKTAPFGIACDKYIHSRTTWANYHKTESKVFLHRSEVEKYN